MIDASDNEKAGLDAANEMAGEYLEWLKKTDLATFTPEEFSQLVEVIVTGYQDKLIEIHAAPMPEADA